MKFFESATLHYLTLVRLPEESHAVIDTQKPPFALMGFTLTNLFTRYENYLSMLILNMDVKGSQSS